MKLYWNKVLIKANILISFYVSV